MTSRKRVQGFLSRTPIDRVPVQLQNMVLAAQATGRDFPEVYSDAALLAEGHVAEWEKYRQDGVIVDVGTHAAAQAMGCPVEYTPGALPRVTGPAISDLRQAPALRVPDIRSTFPLTVVLDAVARLRKRIGAHAVIIATVDQGPFTLATQVAGLEKMLLAIATGEADTEIETLIQRCTAFARAYGQELARSGADVIRMGDSISGPDLVSPAVYRRFAMPAQRSLAEAFAAEGITFAFHVCGNAGAIVQDMVSTGAAYVEIDEKTDQDAARRAVRGRGGIHGTVSPRALRFESAAEVHRQCRAVLEAWMPAPGLFFGPGCTLAADTPEENIRVLIDCASRYGSYGERGTHAVKQFQ